MITRLLSMLGIHPAVAGVLGAAVLAIATYVMGKSDANADWTARHAAYVAQQAEARATTLQKYLAELRAEQERGDALSVKLLSTNAENARLSDDIKKRVPRVSTVYIEKPGAAPAPLPDRPFTAGWVRDYNAALGLGMSGQAASAGGAAGTAAAVRPADALAGPGTDVVAPAGR
jgi:hypothetical protein